MSPIVTQTTTQSLITGYREMVWDEYTIPSATVITRERVGVLSIYSLFITVTILLALFFVASLVLTLTSQYFMDWGSAFIGLLGSSGLALVGWYSKLQIRK